MTIREIIANIIHEIWAHWMLYVFSRCEVNEDGSVTIPPALVLRWKRQINTPYNQLDEGEKRSDREQAAKVIKALVEALNE